MKDGIRVGVLRGGPSAEYDVSLASGAAVLDALRAHSDGCYQPRDIFIDKQGIWHSDGLPFVPADAQARFDVAFNALHGTYGEDGKVQYILETHGMPFSGSDALSSAVAMNKILTKRRLESQGIKSPYWKEISAATVIINPAAAASELFRSFLMPAVIKPASAGSSFGVSIASTIPELAKGLSEAARHSDAILVEEFITGIEATCGVIEDFRNQELYALPPIEIRPKNTFFDYESKYSGESEEIVPATFSEDTKRQLETLSKDIHRMMGLRHYSRSDFMIHPRRGIYFLEVNTLPGLTNESLMPKALRSVGSNLGEFVEHVITLAVAS